MRVVYGVVACAQVYAITRCQVHKIKNDNLFWFTAKVCECGYILCVHVLHLTFGTYSSTLSSLRCTENTSSPTQLLLPSYFDDVEY